MEKSEYFLFLVKPGMNITVREKSQKIPMIVEGAEKSVSGNSATFVA
jgi:hypothetical protein